MAQRWDIHEFDEVESTNKIVKSAIAEGASAGFVAIAKSQTCGYGMRGHEWISPLGGLYMSCLFDCNMSHEELPQLPKILAEKLLPVLNLYTAEELTIKEPNDIVFKKRTGNFFHKLAGISTEVYRGKICVGIGVNVYPPEQEIKIRSGNNLIAYLSDLTDGSVELDDLRDCILEAWGSLINYF